MRQKERFGTGSAEGDQWAAGHRIALPMVCMISLFRRLGPLLVIVVCVFAMMRHLVTGMRHVLRPMRLDLRSMRRGVCLFWHSN